MGKPGAMLSEILKHLTKKPNTVLYPYERLKIPEKFRGKIAFHQEKCNSCTLCFRACPAKAIEMVKRNEGEKPKPIFMLDRCLFCAQCEEVCPADAIELTKEFELAGYDRKEMVVR